VLCTDVTPHRLWVHEGIDLFLVTSHAAAAAVRRYLPTARIAVVPPPVRPAFHRAPARAAARAELGIDPTARCALVMGGGWGLGPVAGTAHALAAAGVEVLAVAGSNRRLAQALDGAARDQPRVRPFGFTDRVPLLMAASDVVITTPGATTCSEARAVGRPLVLLDVVPGHGRDNVQHELELGNADVCDADPRRLVASVLAVLDRSTMADHGARDAVGMSMNWTGPGGTGTDHGRRTGQASTGAAPGATWGAAFAEALAEVTTHPGTPAGVTTHPGTPAGTTTHPGTPAEATTHHGTPAGVTTHPGTPAGTTTHPGTPAEATTHHGTPAGATASPTTTGLSSMATEPTDAVRAGPVPEEAD
jgi:hypothetical protein